MTSLLGRSQWEQRSVSDYSIVPMRSDGGLYQDSNSRDEIDER